MPWGFFFLKNDEILNETYSDTVGTFSEWDLKVLSTQESFAHLEKS